ncbi:MAG: DMT family transporter, partial [Pseudomonadota bacterium]
MDREYLRDFFVLFLLAAFWGGSFVFIKIGVDHLAPALLTSGRLLIGAIILWSVVFLSRQSLSVPKAAITPLVVAAFFNMGLPFTLISWSEIVIDSNRAGILMAIMP